MRDAWKRALEGYRWLWRAQRRWKSDALWVACVQFVARVVADIMRSVRPRGPVSSAIAVVVAVITLGIAMARVRERDPDPQPAAWRHDAGGFAVAFPAPWESASDDDVVSVARFGEPVPGSAYRRAAGGVLFPRFVTAQTYALGEIVSINGATRSLTQRVVGPVESLVGAEIASRGVRVTAHRFEDGGEPLTRAAVVFRGRNADGYVIGLTGRREDESIVLAAARQIADSIRHDEEPLTDGEIRTAALHEIPLEALLAARAMSYVLGERRDSALWSLLPVDVPDAATVEECRAAAIPFLAGMPLGRGTPASTGFETQVTCRASVVSIRANLRRLLVRQFDSSGAQIYEATTELGITPAEPRFWVVNGNRYELSRGQFATPIVRVRIGG